MKTCLNRLIKICENKCQRDYDTNHHPNNYDCPNYYEANIIKITIMERESLMYKIHMMDVGLGNNGNGHHHLEQKTKKMEKVL